MSLALIHIHDDERKVAIRPGEQRGQQKAANTADTEERDALTGLTAAHREILVEVYFRDRSLAEIAGGLGIPLGTAKSRVHYALRALRQKLEGRRPTTIDA